MRETRITAGEAISTYKQASIRREFPSEYLDKSLAEIETDARSGNAAARTALKLLFGRQYDK